jgi:hypothetical protein
VTVKWLGRSARELIAVVLLAFLFVEKPAPPPLHAPYYAAVSQAYWQAQTAGITLYDWWAYDDVSFAGHLATRAQAERHAEAWGRLREGEPVPLSRLALPPPEAFPFPLIRYTGPPVPYRPRRRLNGD